MLPSAPIVNCGSAAWYVPAATGSVGTAVPSTYTVKLDEVGSGDFTHDTAPRSTASFEPLESVATLPVPSSSRHQPISPISLPWSTAPTSVAARAVFHRRTSASDPRSGISTPPVP